MKNQWGVVLPFAHAIKARTYLHQSKTSTSNATKALAEVALSFASNLENAKYTFIILAGERGYSIEQIADFLQMSYTRICQMRKLQLNDKMVI